MRGVQENPEGQGKIDAEDEYDDQRDKERARGPWWLSCMGVWGCIMIVLLAGALASSMDWLMRYLYESGILKAVGVAVLIIVIAVVAAKVILYIIDRMDD